MTHPLQAIRNSNICTSHQSADSHFNEQLYTNCGLSSRVQHPSTLTRLPVRFHTRDFLVYFEFERKLFLSRSLSLSLSLSLALAACVHQSWTEQVSAEVAVPFTG